MRSRTFVCTLMVLAASIPYPATAEIVPDVAAPSTPTLRAGIVTSPAPARTLGLSDCLDRANNSNKEILSAKWSLAVAKAGITVAGAIPNPQFELQEGFGPSFTSVITGQNEQIQWTQQIQTAGKRSKQIDQARSNYGLTELQFEALKFDVHNRVRRAYAELAAAEAYAQLIEAERAVGLKLLSIADKRFTAGKVPQSEVLQAKLSVSQFDTQQNSAQVRLQQDSAALGLLIGETPNHIEIIDVNDNGLFKLSAEKTEIVPSPLEPLTKLSSLLDTAIASRLDLKACQQSVVVARKALAIAKARRVPDLYVGGGFQYMHLSKNQVPNVSPAPNHIGSGTFINVSAENPFFYQYQGEIQQAAATYRQAQRKCDLLRTQIYRDTTVAYNEVRVTRANIFLFQQDLLPTASEVARIARRGYQFGATDLATAIVAQQQYQQTLSSYFDAVVSYQTAWADLEKAVGIPLRI